MGDRRKTSDNGPRKKLTFDVDRDTHRKFKAWCAVNGTSMVSWLNERIGETLNGAADR